MPLVFLGQDYAVSEAQIAYVEVPKVALLRTLAGLIALLWALEWAIKGGAFQGSFTASSPGDLARKLHPFRVAAGLKNWLNVHPIHWLVFAAGLFFGSTLLSTALSGSPINSLWGEIPGQDGYALYTVASYGVLFSVMATHLRTPAQLGRLLGVVVLMGVVVGSYGVMQHYGNDFLGLTEETGGGSARVTIFMGNTIFAGAVLAMTIPVTIMVAVINLHHENWADLGPLRRLGQLEKDTVATALWALILSVQLLGLMFTFSRGPWGGAVLAIVVFLGLIAVSMGLRTLIRTSLIVGLAGILLAGFLHLQGNVSIVNAGPWLGAVIMLLGLAGAYVTLLVIRRFARATVLIVALGAAVVIAGAVVIGPSALANRGAAESSGGGGDSGSTAAQLTQRIGSIKTDVLGGFIGGRGTHWKVSWELIKHRPWFEFDELHFRWLRPLVGYGPDLFRYTYLLESPPDEFNFLPLEPDNAHNFFIHQTVEQGIFGGVAALALFATVFGVAGHHLLRRRRTANPVYQLVLFGLAAVIAGRFLEMMVGVAKVSDLTVLWVLFGVFAALVRFESVREDSVPDAPPPNTRREGRRNRRRTASASSAQSGAAGLMFRLAIVAWLAGGIGVVTWQKSINSVRASVAEGQALEYFRDGDLDSTVVQLDKAIALAPGVPNYYNNRAQVYLNYQLQPDLFTEPGCSRQVDLPYEVCLANQSLQSNLESIEMQPFNYRARIAAANSAFNLQLNDAARELYSIAVSMVPNAWPVRNDLAESQIDVGLYEEALTQLNFSLAITGDIDLAIPTYYLKGRALEGLGRYEEAIATLKRGLAINYPTGGTPPAVNLIREIHASLGVESDVDYFTEQIRQNPEDAIALFYRGLAYFATGEGALAFNDIEKSYSLGFSMDEVLATLGFVAFKNDITIRGGFIVGRNSRSDLASALRRSPQNALINAYYAEYQSSAGNLTEGLALAENASLLDPDLGLAYLIRAEILARLEAKESAREVLDMSEGLKLPSPQHYADRGEIYAYFGEYDKAFSEIGEAIRIKPDTPNFYYTRAKAYATFQEFESALTDFDTAIRLDPGNATYFTNRGVLYHVLGKQEQSLADFETAKSISGLRAPPLDYRNAGFFTLNAVTHFD